MDVIIIGQSTTFFGHFWHVDSQSIKQTGDPWESLLLTSENAVFCKNWTLMTIIDNVWSSNHDRQSLTVISLCNHLQCLPIPHEILKRKRTCLYYGDVDPQDCWLGLDASVEVDLEANADDDVDFWGRTDVWRSITDLDWHVSRSPPSNSTHRTPAQAIPHPIIVLRTDKDKFKHSHQTLYSSKSKVVISWWKNAARQLRQPSTEVQSGKNQVKFDTGVQMVRLLLSNTFQHCSSTANCKMEDLDNQNRECTLRFSPATAIFSRILVGSPFQHNSRGDSL